VAIVVAVAEIAVVAGAAAGNQAAGNRISIRL